MKKCVNLVISKNHEMCLPVLVVYIEEYRI